MALPLSGIRVLDLTRILAGPFCTMKLGDMGAEVIKIESPGMGDETRRWGPPFLGGESAYFLSVNRNKKSVTVDLKQRIGKEIIRKLIRRSDVLVENFRPGVLARLGFGYASVRKLNPRIIYCSISGYGQRSSWKRKPSYELLIQGESGLMDLTGFAEGPPTKVGISLTDVNAGSVAFEAILLALIHRRSSGRGCQIDISLLEATLSLFSYQAQMVLSKAQKVGRMGNLHPTITPYETFRTADGYINVAIADERSWKKFCSAIRRPALAGDKRYATNAARVRNRVSLQRILASIIRTRSSNGWMRLLEKKGIPAGRINSLEEALQLPPIRQLKTVITTNHPTVSRLSMIRNPITPPGGTAAPTAPPPLLGHHTEAVLRQIGYSADTILRIRRRGIV